MMSSGYNQTNVSSATTETHQATYGSSAAGYQPSSGVGIGAPQSGYGAPAGAYSSQQQTGAHAQSMNAGIVPAAAPVAGIPSNQYSHMEALKARDRAIFGVPSLGLNIGEYDHVRHQPPNVTMFVQPYAFPSALGMMALWAGLWVYATWIAEWYGEALSGVIFWGILLVFGGLAQYWAGWWCFKARDNLGLVLHTAWGSFFVATALYFLINNLGLLARPNLQDCGSDEFAMMAVPIAILTWVCVIASLGRDMIWFILTLLLAIGLTVQFAGHFACKNTAIKVGAYFQIVAGFFALYRGFAYVVEDSFQRSVLPVFRFPAQLRHPLQKIPIGEPGVIRGQ